MKWIYAWRFLLVFQAVVTITLILRGLIMHDEFLFLVAAFNFMIMGNTAREAFPRTFN